MAKRVGHSGRIEYLPWAEAQRIAQTEPNIGILSLTRSPERENGYRWIAKILTDDLIVVGGQGIDVSALDKVSDRPTGVLARSGAEALLKERGFTRIQPADRGVDERAPDPPAPHRRLARAAADGHLRDDRDARRPRRRSRSARSSARARSGSPARATCPTPEAAKWQKAFEAMKADGTYQRIADRYNRMKILPIPDDLRRRFSEPVWDY